MDRQKRYENTVLAMSWTGSTAATLLICALNGPFSPQPAQIFADLVHSAAWGFVFAFVYMCVHINRSPAFVSSTWCGLGFMAAIAVFAWLIRSPHWDGSFVFFSEMLGWGWLCGFLSYLLARGFHSPGYNQEEMPR